MESYSRGERNNTKMIAVIGAILVVIVLILYGRAPLAAAPGA